MVSAAKVITVDIGASNGVIHVINTVLMPPAEKKMAPKDEKTYYTPLSREYDGPRQSRLLHFRVVLFNARARITFLYTTQIAHTVFKPATFTTR
jgi:hypothetical protein